MLGPPLSYCFYLYYALNIPHLDSQYHSLVLCEIMNNKQRKTLQAIFKKPTPTNLEWRAVASLIKALGGEVKHGDGSRVRIDLKNISVNIHSPHPQKEIPRYAVRLVKELLERTGDKP